MTTPKISDTPHTHTRSDGVKIGHADYGAHELARHLRNEAEVAWDDEDLRDYLLWAAEKLISQERELAEANRALAEERRAHQREVDGAMRDCMDKAKKIGDLRVSVEALVEALQWAAAFIECSKEPLPSPKLTSKIDAALSQAQENAK